MKQTYPIETSFLILLIQTFVLSSIIMGQHIKYTDKYLTWKICGSNLGTNIVITLNRKVLGSNLGKSKRAIYSPKHPDKLQHPPSLQLNVNQGFFSGSKVARGMSLSVAISPLNLSASMAHTGTLF